MIIHPANAAVKKTQYRQFVISNTLSYNDTVGTFSGTIATWVDFFDFDGKFIAPTYRQQYCPSFTIIQDSI